ncbi:MAG: phenylalanine--tRNA ligase subunit beta [Dehalococcoidia bacterium]|nr:phenylalanine--tRNA ligase subunit beta [Dehalococcoidia bacterium]
MLVSLNWLREYVDLPADLDVEALAARLTMASAEVEGIRRVGDWDRALVTVGHVLAVEAHPQADRLRLVTVDYGGDAPQQVVCGAPNVATGQRIAFAREGARLFDGHSGAATVLKRSKIRGVESAGMVLSERELGLSEAHEGIVVLPADAPVGAPLADVLGDVILDVHTWPNRADTMSMVGIARELAALLGAALLGVAAHAPPSRDAEPGAPVADAVRVRIEAPALCQRYVAAVVEGVHVGPSPEWLAARLRAAGVRPVTNVVDVTNYVLMELGQPLHAFDFETVRGDVVVRAAHGGERLRTLDGVDRELTADTLLIADASGPIALAGVMGGAATEVTERTTTVLLESARFEPASIRRTSQRLHLRSEASARFERGLAPELALHAARRAVQLLVEVCGGTARAGVVDVYPAPQPTPEVTLTRARLDTLLGFAVPDAEVERDLRALGFAVRSEVRSEVRSAVDARAGAAFVVRPPWWRTDIAIADDVAEEVLRLAGYDRLPATTLRGAVPPHERAPLRELREQLRDALAAAGLREVITYSLTTDAVLRHVVPAATLDDAPPLRLQHALSSEHELLRTTLRHSLLEAVARNVRAGASEIALFEAARVYLPRRGAGGEDAGGALPDERELVCGALSGAAPDRWSGPDRALDFFDAKGVLEAAAEAIGVAFEFAALAADDAAAFGLLPGRVARISLGGATVGVLGEVHPHTLAAFDIAQPVQLFELDVATLLAQLPPLRRAVSPPRFPAVEQDLAVVVDEQVAAGALLAAIRASRLVEAARVFDVYRGEQLGAGKKSVAVAIRYRAADRTLTTEEANREQARLVARLAREFGAVLRG